MLLLRRFDREKVEGGYHRHRMVSALTLLRAEDSPTDTANWSYLRLADEVQRRTSRPRADKEVLYRRVVFNALISNNDDHPRNHAVVAAGEGWRLAPAYDLTPSPQRGRQERDLALACGLHGRRASRHNLLSATARFGIGVGEGESIIEELAGVIGRYWRSEVSSCGGSEEDLRTVAPAFLHPGFDYPPSER